MRGSGNSAMTIVRARTAIRSWATALVYHQGTRKTQLPNSYKGDNTICKNPQPLGWFGYYLGCSSPSTASPERSRHCKAGVWHVSFSSRPCSFFHIALPGPTVSSMGSKLTAVCPRHVCCFDVCFPGCVHHTEAVLAFPVTTAEICVPDTFIALLIPNGFALGATAASSSLFSRDLAAGRRTKKGSGMELKKKGQTEEKEKTGHVLGADPSTACRQLLFLSGSQSRSKNEFTSGSSEKAAFPPKLFSSSYSLLLEDTHHTNNLAPSQLRREYIRLTSHIPHRSRRLASPCTIPPAGNKSHPA
jgi:hypothetical protein